MTFRKTVKLSAAFILLLAMGHAVNASATTSILIKDAASEAGSQSEIPIEVVDASNIGSLDITLTYDPGVLSVRNVTNGELTSTSLLQWNTNPPGTLLIAIIDCYGIDGDGSLAIVTFHVVGSEGATSHLTLEAVEANDVDALTLIPIATKSGQFIVEEARAHMPAFSWWILGAATVVIVLAVAATFLWRRRKYARAYRKKKKIKF